MNRKLLRLYAVLEHAAGKQDAKLHGIYKRHASASGKKIKLKQAGAKGYVSVLEMKVRDFPIGPKRFR